MYLVIVPDVSMTSPIFSARVNGGEYHSGCEDHRPWLTSFGTLIARQHQSEEIQRPLAQLY